MKIEFADKVGNILQPGDLVIYGHALGRCAGIRYGKALRSQLSRSEYQPKVHLRVQGVADDWEHVAAELAKPGTLQFSERVLRVSRDQVPAKVLALLDGVVVS